MRATLPPRKDGTTEDKKHVLRKALIHVSKQLGLKRRELSAIIGPSESFFSKLFSKSNYYLDPASKEGELAVLFIKLYRSLALIFGGNREQCRLWMRSENAHLGMMPLQLVQSIPGLIHTVEYLDVIGRTN